MRKTLVSLIVISLWAAPAPAQLLPEALSEFERASAEPYSPEPLALYEEFGFEEGETAVYRTASGQQVNVIAQQYYDDTGAYSAYQWASPEGAEIVELGERAAKVKGHTWIHFGNYLVEITGADPDPEVVELMLAYLPRVRMTPDPPVARFMPEERRIANSERHILGPLALEQLAPEVPPSVAGFNFGTEAHFARFDTPNGEHRLLLFNYPSGQIALGQIEEFYKIPSVVAKRTGPIIAVVPAPPSPDEAQRLLSRVRYQGEITLSERPPQRHDNLATLLTDIVVLCGILAVLMILGGILVAVARSLAGRFVPDSILSPRDYSVTQLKIDDH